MPLQIIFCILFGYLIGGINPSYIIGRIKGFDIRKSGSGNAGASNAVITMGKTVGIFSAIFDILKATVVMLTAPLIFKGLSLAAEIAGASVILGHIFPVFMKFKGGKGLACLGGAIIAIDWRFFLIILAAELVLLFAVDYICIVPITASVITPLIYGFSSVWGLPLKHATGGLWGALILGVASLAILSRHVENIRRIRAGVEMHFSYLYTKDKDKEIARIAENRKKNRHED